MRNSSTGRIDNDCGRRQCLVHFAQPRSFTYERLGRYTRVPQRCLSSPYRGPPSLSVTLWFYLNDWMYTRYQRVLSEQRNNSACECMIRGDVPTKKHDWMTDKALLRNITTFPDTNNKTLPFSPRQRCPVDGRQAGFALPQGWRSLNRPHFFGEWNLLVAYQVFAGVLKLLQI
jgi:hypothetical protein